jgi:hypothetical protein
VPAWRAARAGDDERNRQRGCGDSGGNHGGAHGASLHRATCTPRARNREQRERRQRIHDGFRARRERGRDGHAMHASCLRRSTPAATEGRAAGLDSRPRQDAAHDTLSTIPRSTTMANRSSKSQGSRTQGSQSSMSKSSDPSQGTDAQSCPTPSEPRRDTSISNDDEEEE